MLNSQTLSTYFAQIGASSLLLDASDIRLEVCWLLSEERNLGPNAAVQVWDCVLFVWPGL